ncbi:MAG: LuxR C-terminal-related transcriptional regulator [Rubrivivax sp.]
MLRENLNAPEVENRHQALSNREMETPVLIASGKRLADIAEKLALSPKTVSVYRAWVLEKPAAEQRRADGLCDPAQAGGAVARRCSGPDALPACEACRDGEGRG